MNSVFAYTWSAGPQLSWLEQRTHSRLVRSRVRVFSAIYGGISRVKRHHSGAVGRVLGKEMGKEIPALWASQKSAHFKVSYS